MDTKERGKKPAAGRSTKPQTRKSVNKPGPVNKQTRPVKKQVQRPARKERMAQPGQDVVYTQPGLHDRRLVILYLVSVLGVVLAFVFSIAIFFKASTVTVSGNEKYTTEEIIAASGVRPGENLLGVNRAKISSRIRENLPYVYSVRVGIKLPDTVRIEVVELEVVYAAEADDGSWWLLRSDGVIVEKTNSADAAQHTKIAGVLLTNPQVGKRAEAAQPLPDETTPDGETVPITVTGAEQLDVAISLMQYLEESGILGEIATIDVGDLGNLEMWYGTQFRVLLGDTTDLKNKVFAVKGAIDKSGDTEQRILDATFTTGPNQVISWPLK